MIKHAKREDLEAAIFETGEDTPFELVKEYGWINEGKYQYNKTILKENDGTFWRYEQTRTGSPLTDWYGWWDYEPEEVKIYQVREVEEVITAWVDL
jgi:hypothetical protein